MTIDEDSQSERTPRPLEYRGPNATPPIESSLPPAAGFTIGVGLFIAVVGGCALLPSVASMRLEATFILVLCAPFLALVVAGAVQTAFGWRLVAAGALTALGVCALVGCLGIAVLCGGR